MKTLLILPLVLLLAACAYSPQQVTIEPALVIENNVYGNSRVVAVLTEDKRAEKVLGTRGGAYQETSTISIANDMTAAVTAAAESALRQQGFVVDASQPASAEMRIIIDTLSYDKVGASMTNKFDLKAVLRTEIKANGETHKGRYVTKSSQQLAWAPSTEKNSEMINVLLSDTLQRMFDDEKVKDFFSK